MDLHPCILTSIGVLAAHSNYVSEVGHGASLWAVWQLKTAPKLCHPDYPRVAESETHHWCQTFRRHGLFSSCR